MKLRRLSIVVSCVAMLAVVGCGDEEQPIPEPTAQAETEEQPPAPEAEAEAEPVEVVMPDEEPVDDALRGYRGSLSEVTRAARAAYDSCRADAPGDDRFEDDLVGDPGFPPPPPELMLGI